MIASNRLQLLYNPALQTQLINFSILSFTTHSTTLSSIAHSTALRSTAHSITPSSTIHFFAFTPPFGQAQSNGLYERNIPKLEYFYIPYASIGTTACRDEALFSLQSQMHDKKRGISPFSAYSNCHIKE
ncbi:hypothetical protein VNO78_29163 [Psophocarpus tetragonolobus]|uniref:Uncharacterized protein n=1 Tax=Psophocarpus tetragonolobus TaxID=3891 RepID=A0AAN9RUV9_PSOTE